MALPVVGLVLGDCTGIGPEQCARVLHDGRMAAIARLVVIGDARVLERGMEHAAEVVSWGLMDETVPIIRIYDTEPAQLSDAFDALVHRVPLWSSPAASEM